MTQKTDFRALCAELLADYEQHLYRSVLADRARAALAQPEPESRPAPAPAEAGGYDKDVRRMCEIILGNTFGNEELDSLALLVGHHPDVLNASPVPAPVPAEVEVAELVARLRRASDGASAMGWEQDSWIIARAADLLEQRHPTPVPMSERLPGPGDCDAGRCYWGRQDSGRQQWNWTFSTIPMGDTHWLPAFVQSLPTIVLPLPQGEVQP